MTEAGSNPWDPRTFWNYRETECSSHLWEEAEGEKRRQSPLRVWPCPTALHQGPAGLHRCVSNAGDRQRGHSPQAPAHQRCDARRTQDELQDSLKSTGQAVAPGKSPGRDCSLRCLIWRKDVGCYHLLACSKTSVSLLYYGKEKATVSCGFNSMSVSYKRGL